MASAEAKWTFRHELLPKAVDAIGDAGFERGWITWKRVVETEKIPEIPVSFRDLHGSHDPTCRHGVSLMLTF